MKTKFIPVLLTFLLVFISCGKEKETAKEEEKPESEPVEMMVEYKYNFKDTFKVYYSTDSKKAIDGSLMLTMPIEATNEFQKTTFIFPLGEFPRIIRFDCGNNQEADKIEIKNISITHGDNVLDNSDWVTTTNWSPNQSLKVDEKLPNTYAIVPVDGVKGPVFMSNVVAQEKLDKYFNAK